MGRPSKVVATPAPCPNCKGSTLIQTWGRMTGRAVVCLICGVHGPKVVCERGSKEAVTAAWGAWERLPRSSEDGQVKQRAEPRPYARTVTVVVTGGRGGLEITDFSGDFRRGETYKLAERDS